MKVKTVGVVLLSGLFAMPFSALAKDVCLKTADSGYYLKLSGLKNLKVSGKVSPIHGYLRTLSAKAGVIFLRLDARQVVHSSAIGLGENKVRLSLVVDHSDVSPLIRAEPYTLDLRSLTSSDADVKTLAGSYKLWNLDGSTSLVFEPVKCREADSKF